MNRGRAVRRARDRGASTIEYIGLAVAGALLVGFVLVALTQAKLSGRVAAAVCSVLQQDNCQQFGDQVQTALEKALAGDYVQMGDSFASGEGAGGYKEGTDFDKRDDWNPANWGDDSHNRCRRSSSSYADTVYGAMATDGTPFKGSLVTVACSGARLGADVDPTTTEDTQGGSFDGPNPDNTGENPQMDALNEKTSLVTLSIGGNDLGFGDVLKACMWNGERGIPFGQCQSNWDTKLNDRITALEPQLVAQYKAIKEKAPNARVIVMGYPPLFNNPPSESLNNLLFKEDQLWMNGKAGDLNAMLRRACREAGVEFIDPTNAFKGHGIGSDTSYLNDMDWGGPGIAIYDPGSFHPNAQGHAVMADLVKDQLKNPKYP